MKEKWKMGSIDFMSEFALKPNTSALFDSLWIIYWNACAWGVYPECVIVSLYHYSLTKEKKSCQSQSNSRKGQSMQLIPIPDISAKLNDNCLKSISPKQSK